MRYGHFIALVASLLVVTGATLADETAQQKPPAPPAPVLLELDLPDELRWYYQNDVGMLLIYAAGHLHRVDLLDRASEELSPIEFPALSRPGSVIPIARTGIFLIPEAPAGLLARGATGTAGDEPDRDLSSYAVDTLGGTLLWEAPPLPPPAVLLSFPDVGLVVVRSQEKGGRLVAVDLRTGETPWTRKMPLRTLWSDDRYLRLMSGDRLVTVDVLSGESVREEVLDLPKETRVRAYPAEEILIAWKKKVLKGFSLPPPPPAAVAPPRPLWEFKAGSAMMNICIDGARCIIERVADDRLMVRSVRRNELLRLSTGELLVTAKLGMLGFKMPVMISPGGEFVAVAESDDLVVYEGTFGEQLHKIRYPKGGKGMKTLKHIRWLNEEVVLAVFPDKRGNPRKMSAFSCAEGSLSWTFVLPDAADYSLTSDQSAALILRIMLSLVTAAYSANNPMSVGGADYAVILVPNLDVSTSLNAGPSIGREAGGGTTGGEPVFAAARDRVEELARRKAAAGRELAHFVTGPDGEYEILAIDLEEGHFSPVVRYTESEVHSIAPFTAFELALTVEKDNRRVRVISLRDAAGGS